MKHVAEITCLACGRGLGRLERREDKVVYVAAAASPNTADVTRKGRGLVCTRCGGRALVGPMERVVSYAA